MPPSLGGRGDFPANFVSPQMYHSNSNAMAPPDETRDIRHLDYSRFQAKGLIRTPPGFPSRNINQPPHVVQFGLPVIERDTDHKQ